jgi:hypothetical protein
MAVKIQPQWVVTPGKQQQTLLLQNAPICFGASAPSRGRFGIGFANVIKY